MKERLKAGALSLEQLFKEGDDDETLAKLKVVSVLESMPGVGKVGARRLMEELDISESRRLARVGREPAQEAAPAVPLSTLLVISGPSGTGKGTIVRRLLEREPGLWFSVSANTRPPRRARSTGATTGS